MPPPTKRAKTCEGVPPPRVTRGAVARALARVLAIADEPDDQALFPLAVRAAGGGRFPWHIALQFLSLIHI